MAAQTAGNLILPPPPPLYDVLDQRQTREALQRYAQTVSALPQLTRPYIYAKDYRVVGDGVTDDTAAMQDALDAGARLNSVVYAGQMVVSVTGPLSMAGPGLAFDVCAPGAPGDPGIVASGDSGYTVLEITGHLTTLCVGIYSTTTPGATVNGFYFNNPQQSQIQHIRAYNLQGFGVRIGKCWDCDFYSISVEYCRDATVYAFGMYGEGDTCNMTTIHHLQVERCMGRTIYVEPTSLCCKIENIHSEQSDPIAGVDTWALSGASCMFEMCRFSPNEPTADATLKLGGENNTFVTFRVEGASTVTAAESNFGVSINLFDFNCATFALTLGQTGTVNVTGGHCVRMNADPGLRVQSMIITTLSCGFTANPPNPTFEQFHWCTIATLSSSSTLSAATFIDCTIAECGNLLQGTTVLVSSTVTAASTIGLGSAGLGKLIAINSTINGALQYHNSAPIRAINTIFNGTMTSDGGNTNLLFDAKTTVGAGSSAVGVPTGGAHVVGDRHVNPLPTSGGTSSWACTVAGTPGTFIAEGTTGSGTTHTLTLGTHLTGGSYDGSANVTAATDATSANTANTIVARDGSGNISVGTVTASGVTSSGNVSASGGTVSGLHFSAGDMTITGGGAVSAGSSTATFLHTVTGDLQVLQTPSASSSTATHSVPMIFNGVTYNVLLHS